MLIRAQAARIAAIQKVYGAVVCVFGKDPSVGGGSGVLIDPSGLTVTNHHVVAAAGTDGLAGLADGKLYPWRLVGTDPGGDIAVIQLKHKEPFPIARVGDSDAVDVGDWALVMGNPFALSDNYQPTVTMGIVSGVKRYQPGGGGKNQLIYGNCIQVDASINPGNSGGPLFNMQSEVIGINGRGSFKERGRVNVGLGYAVSSQQVLNFLPDLLATKIALHGTLDALFSNRGGKVVCSTLDLDSSAALAGLELGDEMVSFDGAPITDANEFTNLVTTLPAGWPVRLVYRRRERERTIDVPLSPLPYSLVQPEEEKDPHEAPGDVPGQTDDPPAPGPDGPPRGRPRPGLAGPQWNLAKAGTITDAKLSEENARRILDRLSATARGDEKQKSSGWRIKNTLARGDARVGRHELLLAADGRFRMDATLGDTTESFGFNGREFWRTQGDATEVLTVAQWIEQPLRMQALALAVCVEPKVLSSRGSWTLDGGDRIEKDRAYRLHWKGEKDASLLLWVSLDVAGDLARHELLAIGAGEPGALAPGGGGARIVFGNHAKSGLALPLKCMITKDKIDLTATTEACDREETIPDSSLEKPGDAK